MKNLFFALATFMLISIVSCEKGNNTPGNGQDIQPINLDQSTKELVNADNLFGLDLFKEVVAEEDQDKNLFVSPVSVALALAMTYNGANGETEEAMRETLRLYGLTDEAINKAYEFLMAELVSLDEKVQLSIANSIWYRNNFPVLDEFVDINQQYYNAEVESLDFSDPTSKETINGWVEDQTNGKIKDLIDQIDPSHVMFLINAIYFKGMWQLEFDKANTYERAFYPEDGSTTQVMTMSMEDSAGYYENDAFRAIELAYGRGNYNMVVLLPIDEKNTNDIVNQLTTDNWEMWMDGFAKTKVNISLPRFKFEYEIKLNDVLKNMGMGIAFGSAADFTGIVKNGGIYIDYVKHKSFVEVNEEGTEAAAATVVAIKEFSMPDMKYFTANKPFLFAITEKSSGAIVFMGRVSNP